MLVSASERTPLSAIALLPTPLGDGYISWVLTTAMRYQCPITLASALMRGPGAFGAEGLKPL